MKEATRFQLIHLKLISTEPRNNVAKIHRGDELPGFGIPVSNRRLLRRDLLFHEIVSNEILKSAVSQVDRSRLRPPIRENVDNTIGLLRIVRFHVHCKVMLSIHAGMHHEDRGFNCGALTRLEYHRTDG